MWPLRCVDHLPDRPLGDVEEPGQVDGRDRGVVLDRVLRERLADVDAGVVDQRVDPPEPIERLRRPRARAVSASAMSPATATKSVRPRTGARARVADDGISGATECGYEARADALRCAGDDRDRRAFSSSDEVGLVDHAAGPGGRRRSTNTPLFSQSSVGERPSRSGSRCGTCTRLDRRPRPRPSRARTSAAAVPHAP